MDKLVAVTVYEKGGRTLITGYRAREKNRQRVWTLDITDIPKAEVATMVTLQEDFRLHQAGPQGEVEPKEALQ